ncbi:hypothetical protein AB5I41_13980 [Sphingomonas sp. MMS24-JH45]
MRTGGADLLLQHQAGDAEIGARRLAPFEGGAAGQIDERQPLVAQDERRPKSVASPRGRLIRQGNRRERRPPRRRRRCDRRPAASGRALRRCGR